MAMSQLDIVNLTRVIKKNTIIAYDDLYIDSRSKLNIYDFLNASILITLKFLEKNQSEKNIFNGLSAIEVTLMKMYYLEKEIKEEHIKKILEIRQLVAQLNNEKLNEKLNNIIRIYQSSICDYKDREKSEIDVEEVINTLNSETEKEPENEEIEYIDVTEEMQELKSMIESLQNRINELEKDVKRKDEINKKNQQEMEKKKQELSLMREKAKELTKELRKLNNRHKKLEEQYESFKGELEVKKLEIESLKTNNQNMIVENQRLNKYYLEQQSSTFEKKRMEDIVNAVLEVIANKHSTLIEISQILREKGLKTTLSEINIAINELRKKYEIDDSFLINFKKSYFIKSKKPVTNKIFQVNNFRKSCEFMVISDVHMARVSDYIFYTFQKVYEYMFNNNIETIINLGDFLDYGYSSESTRDERIQYNNRIINDIITMFPYEKGISHLIMGGNHEEVILRYGIDPFEVLEANRQDFVSLGNYSSYLKFNNNYIALFHPDFRIKDIDNIDYSIKKLQRVVNSKCNNVNINIDDVFMSLFGHFHHSQVYSDKLISVPSLTNDFNCNGAWRIKLYFDSSKNIEAAELTKIVLGKCLKDAKTYELGKKTKR